MTTFFRNQHLQLHQRHLHPNQVEVVWRRLPLGFGDRVMCLMESCMLTRAICKGEQIPKKLKVPVKSKAAKPAAKRAGKQAAQSGSASSSNPEPVPAMPNERVQEFKVVCIRKKKFHSACGKGTRTAVTSCFNVIDTTGVLHALLQL